MRKYLLLLFFVTPAAFAVNDPSVARNSTFRVTTSPWDGSGTRPQVIVNSCTDALQRLNNFNNEYGYTPNNPLVSLSSAAITNTSLIKYVCTFKRLDGSTTRVNIDRDTALSFSDANYTSTSGCPAVHTFSYVEPSSAQQTVCKSYNGSYCRYTNPVRQSDSAILIPNDGYQTRAYPFSYSFQGTHATLEECNSNSNPTDPDPTDPDPTDPDPTDPDPTDPDPNPTDPTNPDYTEIIQAIRQVSTDVKDGFSDLQGALSEEIGFVSQQLSTINDQFFEVIDQLSGVNTNLESIDSNISSGFEGVNGKLDSLNDTINSGVQQVIEANSENTTQIVDAIDSNNQSLIDSITADTDRVIGAIESKEVSVNVESPEVNVNVNNLDLLAAIEQVSEDSNTFFTKIQEYFGIGGSPSVPELDELQLGENAEFEASSGMVAQFLSELRGAFLPNPAACPTDLVVHISRPVSFSITLPISAVCPLLKLLNYLMHISCAMVCLKMLLRSVQES